MLTTGSVGVSCWPTTNFTKPVSKSSQGSRHCLACLWPTRARLGIGPPLTREADNDRSRQLRWVEAGPCRCRQCSTQSDPQIGSDAPLKGRYIDLVRVTIGCRWGLFGAAYSGLQNACMVCALFVCCRQHGIISYLQPCPTRSSDGGRAHIRRVLLQTAAVTGTSYDWVDRPIRNAPMAC